MLSAVENHLGSGRVYPHPFPGVSTVAGGPSTAALLGQLPLSAAVAGGLPLLAAGGGPNLVDMSVAEFARPHPKQQQRYSEVPRNGLHSSVSARSKYSELPQSPQQQQQQQSGPVNLAVSPNLSNHTQHSSSQSVGLSAAKLNQLSHEFHERSLQAQARAQAQAHAQQQHQQQQQQHRHQEQQKESVADLGKLYSPTNPRLAFFPSPLDANSYAGLNYGLYPFGYPAPHLDARMLGRPTYLPGQREPYNPPSFLTPGSYGSAESPKSKMYPSVSLPHLNGHSGLKPTSLPQLPQDKLLSDERSPTMPLSPSSSSLMGAAVSYAERERSSYLNGLTDHPMHSKYQNSHAAAQHEKENKHEHKQHHSSHSQQQQLHPGSGSVSGGPSLHSLHHFPPPLPATALPPSSSSSSMSPSSSNQRHHSMPHPSSHGHYHGQSHLGHSLSVDGLRLEPTPQENEFKVPSGKEGSLKHRILTRPASERDTRRRSPTTKSTPIFRPFENGSTTNFTKGALIQLADECKRVEDVRTEDFVQTAEKSADLRLAESTTVRITPRNNNVIITFSYDNNRSRVDIEASIEHPFFVYGQGWASYSPEKSMQQFGLKCQKLQVGDICLSLLPRESKPKPVHSSPSQSSAYLAPPPPAGGGPLNSSGQYLPPPQPAPQQLHRHDINGNQTSLHHQQPYHHPHPMMEQSRTAASSQQQLQHLPQNLSRKASHHYHPPLTIPTTATATAVSARLSGAPSYGSYPSGPVFSMPFSAANLSKPHDSPMQPHYSSKTSADPQRSTAISDLSDQPVAMVVDKPVHSSTKVAGSLPPPPPKMMSTEARAANDADVDNDDECAIDASMSRKRRWSAPDASDEADESQRPTQGSKVPQVGNA